MQPKKLSELLPSRENESSLKLYSTVLDGQNTKEISVYSDKTANVQLVATELRKLKAVFPALEKEFIDVLAERIMSKEFTEERIKDAIANVIDNFKYPKPTVADIVGYDCRIRIWDYSEYSNEIYSRKSSGNDFHQHWINGKLYFVKTSECERYNFKPNPKDDA